MNGRTIRVSFKIYIKCNIDLDKKKKNKTVKTFIIHKIHEIRSKHLIKHTHKSSVTRDLSKLSRSIQYRRIDFSSTEEREKLKSTRNVFVFSLFPLSSIVNFPSKILSTERKIKDTNISGGIFFLPEENKPNIISR